MKVIFVFSLFVAVVFAYELSDGDKQKLKEAHTKCQSDPATHIDNTVFKKPTGNEKPVLPPNYGAHMLCMSKASGLQKEDGSLDKDFIKSKVEAAVSDKSKVSGIIDACVVEKDTPEHTALHLMGCFRHKSVHYHHRDEDH